MSIFKDQLKQQIRGGRRRWQASGCSEGDICLFNTEIVAPLRELESEGLVTLDQLHHGNFRFGRYIDLMTIREVYLDS
jgi:hypothetical protein